MKESRSAPIGSIAHLQTWPVFSIDHQFNSNRIEIAIKNRLTYKPTHTHTLTHIQTDRKCDFWSCAKFNFIMPNQTLILSILYILTLYYFIVKAKSKSSVIFFLYSIFPSFFYLLFHSLRSILMNFIIWNKNPINSDCVLLLDARKI